MSRLFRLLRSLVFGSKWEAVTVSEPTRLISGEVVERTWVKRRITPLTLDYEYSAASEKEAEEASWMWAIK
jgi:hypothetical protein